MTDEPETAALAAEQAPASATPDYEAIVARWFNAVVANSPVSRAGEAVNYLTQTALPALIDTLKKGA